MKPPNSYFEEALSRAVKWHIVRPLVIFYLPILIGKLLFDLIKSLSSKKNPEV